MLDKNNYTPMSGLSYLPPKSLCRFSKNKVSIKRLIQNPSKSKSNSSIIIITHHAKDKFLNRIIKQIQNKLYIIKKPVLIRIGAN